MHSNRMHTASFSGRRGCLLWECLPRRCTPLPIACWDIHTPAHCMLGYTLPPVNRMTDRQVLKHYLTTTSFAGSKNLELFNVTIVFKMSCVWFHPDSGTHWVVSRMSSITTNTSARSTLLCIKNN